MGFAVSSGIRWCRNRRHYIGLLISYQYQRTAFKTAYELVTIGFKAWEGAEAMEAYKNDQPETAQYALHHNAKVLEFFYNNKDKDGFPEGTAQDLAITYIRLGKIAQSEGKQKIAEDYFNKGFSVYQKYKQSIGKETSREKLVSLVDKLDAGYKTQPLEFGDAILGKGPGSSK